MSTKLYPEGPKDGRVHVCARPDCGQQVKKGTPAVHVDSNGFRRGRAWYHQGCYVDAKKQPIPVEPKA